MMSLQNMVIQFQNIMVEWLTEQELKIKTISYLIKPQLWLQQMLSEWELINLIFAMLFIIICQKIWKAIIKKQDVPVVMEQIQNVFYYLIVQI